MNLFNRIKPSPVSGFGDSTTSAFFARSNRGANDFFSFVNEGFLNSLFSLSCFSKLESRSGFDLKGLSFSFLNFEKRSPSFLFSNGFENFFSPREENPLSLFDNLGPLLSPKDLESDFLPNEDFLSSRGLSLSKRGLEKFVDFEKRFSLGADPSSRPNPDPDFFLNGLSESGFVPNDERPSLRWFSLSNLEDENFDGFEKLPLPDR
jgi:hypothetical protein